MLRAVLRDGGPERIACVLDLSSRGLMATCATPPKRGAVVELCIGRHPLVGQVQWTEDRRFGVKLQERIDVIAVIGNEAGPATLRAAQKARGKPSVAARLAFSRQVARGFTYGVLMAAMAAGAVAAAQTVKNSLAPLAQVSGILARH